MIFSVPHSGTRSLAKHLAIDTMQHFLPDDRKQMDLTLNSFVHIPVRHPLDVARSWACRNKDGGLTDLLGCYARMFKYIAQREEGTFQVHKVEDIPFREGGNEHMNGDHTARIFMFQSEVIDQVIKPNADWYRQFY